LAKCQTILEENRGVVEKKLAMLATFLLDLSGKIGKRRQTVEK
jgi:hypothetical protein